MLKFTLFLVVVVCSCFTNGKDLIYSNGGFSSYDREYVMVQNTNHQSGQTTNTPLTIELKNPKCYPKACDYGARYTSQENLVFVYSHQSRLYTSNRCKVGRDFVIKTIEYNPISCDMKFCLSHGIGIAAVRSCGTEYCECRSTGVAILRSCQPGFVFSPQFRTCDYDYKVYGCVLAKRLRK